MIGSIVLGLTLVGTFSDPLFIYRPEKITNARLIMDAAHKGAIGLFQVMCKYWHLQSGYKSIAICEKELYKPRANIKAGIMVLSTVRKKYPQCKGELAYRCYFAGHRWQVRRGRTKKAIMRYDAKIKERKEILKSYYSKFIETYMNQIKERN